MSDAVEKFFRAYYACFAPQRIPLSPTTPREMLARVEPDNSGYVEWRLTPQGDKAVDLAPLETVVGIPLPPSFKAWFTRYYTLDMDCSIVRLPECPSNNPLGPLKVIMTASHAFSTIPRQLGLIPFGEESNDVGPLCFDARQPKTDGEWPIVYWDHELDTKPRAIGPTIFSNFEKLIECVTYYLEGGKTLEQREKRIAGFFEIDPVGAGAHGKRYWSSRLSEMKPLPWWKSLFKELQ